MKDNRISRRAMLARSAAAMGAATVIPASALGVDEKPAASNRILLGAIGIGGRGSGVLRAMMGVPDVQVVANCDVRADRRASVKEVIDTHNGNEDCVSYRDFKELLARTDIDAVLITTGSNWHALLSIYSAKAGKDVYSEKPCTMTIRESRELDEAFLRYRRVFQLKYLILTISVISIEVVVIAAVMLTGENNPTLARDTLFSVLADLPTGPTVVTVSSLLVLLAPLAQALLEQLVLPGQLAPQVRREVCGMTVRGHLRER